jgi:hypothetical protein
MWLSPDTTIILVEPFTAAPLAVSVMMILPLNGLRACM